MKLYLNQASPYARLIRVLLIETGLDNETELIFVDPWESPDGSALSDSGHPLRRHVRVNIFSKVRLDG